MNRIQPSSHTRRPGFTLIEMMLVVGIVVILASILVPVALRFTERSSVSTGISMLQRYLAEAKSRAIAERKPSGIRLLAMRPEDRTTSAGLGLPWYDRVEFIEAPGNYNEGFVWGVLPKGGPWVIRVPTWVSNPPDYRTYPGIDAPAEVVAYTMPPALQFADRLYGPFWNLNVVPNMGVPNGGGIPALPADRKQFINFDFLGTAVTTQPLQPVVMPGDHLELLGTGQIYRIIGVTRMAPVPPVEPTVPSFVTLDRPLLQDVPMPLNGQPNYRIIRQPRTIPNTQTVKLPGEVLVSLLPPANLSLGTLTAADRDVNNQIWMRGLSLGFDITFPGKPFPPGAPAGSVQFAPRSIELLFNEAGQLMPNSRSYSKPSNIPGIQNQYFESFTLTGEGIVYLWVHQRGLPDSWINRTATAAEGNADNQALITINARTGQIASFPIDQDAASGNPWSNAQRGRAQGVGGL